MPFIFNIKHILVFFKYILKYVILVMKVLEERVREIVKDVVVI